MAMNPQEKQFIGITITEADRLLTADPAVEGVHYLDFPPSQKLMVLRVEGATEEETLQRSKERFLGIMARGAAINGMLAFEKDVLVAMATGGAGMHFIMAEPGVGKTYEYELLLEALGWDHIQVNADTTIDADQFFIEDVIGSGTQPAIWDRLNAALLTGNGGVSEAGLRALKNLIEDTKIPTKKATGKAADGSAVSVDIIDFAAFDEGQLKDSAALKSVIEGILPQLPKQSSIGRTRGPLLNALITARDSGRPMIVNMDESNYYNWGSASREFTAFMNNQVKGNVFRIQFQDVQGNWIDESFTREQLRNVHVIMTCNQPNPNREQNAQEFSASQLSRLQANSRPVVMDEAAYAHRLTGMLMGLPLSTHVAAAKSYGLTGEPLVRYLQSLITLGMTDEEIKANDRGPIATALLAKADEVTQGCEHIGSALHAINAFLTGSDSAEEVRDYFRTTQTELPSMDGRFFRKLLEHMGATLDASPPLIKNRVIQKDAEGKTIHPFRIYDSKGEQETRVLPENIGTRLVKGLLYYIDQSFPANKDLKEFRKTIGELLVANRVITPDEAMARFGVDEKIHEFAISEGGTGNPAELAAAMINAVPNRFKAEDVAAAQDYLYAIAARTLPGMIDPGENKEVAVSRLFPSTVVQVLLGSLDEQYKQREEGAPAAVPGLIYENGTFVPHLREMDIRDASNLKGMGNQANERVGLAEIFLGSLVRGDTADPLKDIFKPLSTEGITEPSLRIFKKANEYFERPDAPLDIASLLATAPASNDNTGEIGFRVTRYRDEEGDRYVILSDYPLNLTREQTNQLSRAGITVGDLGDEKSTENATSVIKSMLRRAMNRHAAAEMEKECQKMVNSAVMALGKAPEAGAAQELAEYNTKKKEATESAVAEYNEKQAPADKARFELEFFNDILFEKLGQLFVHPSLEKASDEVRKAALVAPSNTVEDFVVKKDGEPDRVTPGRISLAVKNMVETFVQSARAHHLFAGQTQAAASSKGLAGQPQQQTRR